MADRLKDKVALVFGAGSIGEGWGNGKAAAVAYAREGAVVACVDLNAAAAEETATIIRNEGHTAIALCANVTDSEQIGHVVDQVRAEFGRIDILHNNVGINDPGGAAQTSEESWDRVMAINVKGVFLACRAVLPVMEAQGNGAIVNI